MHQYSTAEDDAEQMIEQFNYDFIPLQPEEDTQYELEYDFQEKTSSFILFEKLRTFVELWARDVNSLNINVKESTKIFQLTGKMIEQINAVNIELVLDPHNETSPERIMSMTKDLVQSEISLYATEYKFRKKISSTSSYVHPEERAIGTRYEMKRLRNDKIAIPRCVPSTLQFVRITETIKSFFEDEKFRYLYFKHNSENHICVEGQYKSFCCGSVYKENELFSSDPYALQIQLFHDDFELCSPLQSKAGVHKLNGLYFKIINFPIQYQSKLNYIGLVSLCHSDDIYKSTQADFNNIWEIVVEDISRLETEGIMVGSKRIRGTICWPSFDNLGANVSLGFAGSFTAQYYCRFCECSAIECSTLTEEIESKIRTKENYATHIKIIESMEKIDYGKTHGVKRYCFLNELKYFDMTKNISVDILHDLYEGAMPFVLNLVIDYMIDSKIIKKNELVQMVQFYDYGEMNQKNIPSTLAIGKHSLGQNGSQLKCLFMHFPFIFEKFENHRTLLKVWNTVKTLANVSQIVHSAEISIENLDELQDAISTLLTSIQTNFKKKLTPKLHNLLHYVRIIKSMGPVCYMNIIRFESKHRVFKKLISRSPNFKDVCKTLAVRHQQQFSMGKLGLIDEMSSGIAHVLTTQVCEEDDYLVDVLRTNNNVCATKYIIFNNYKYKEKYFVTYAGGLYEIKKILKINDEILFYCLQYELLEFVPFFNSYKIDVKSPSNQQLIYLKKLEFQKPYEKKISNGNIFIIAESLDIRKCAE